MLETIVTVLVIGFACVGLFVSLFIAFAFFMHWYTTREFKRGQD
jgi:hypothetical protein